MRFTRDETRLTRAPESDSPGPCVRSTVELAADLECQRKRDGEENQIDE